MKTVVVDASAAATWLIETQATTAGELFLLDRADYGFIAPAIFDWEIVNLIVSKARRASLEVDSGLAALKSLRIAVRPPIDSGAVMDLAVLAIEAELSLFDTAYLALAIESGGGIASRDRALLDVAAKHGIDTYDLRDRAPS